jgi:hypothetical protein
MCERIELTPVEIKSAAAEAVLQRLKRNLANGGAFLAAVRFGPDTVFDCFASRNWLLREEMIARLLCREEIRQLLAAVQVPPIDDSERCVSALKSLTDNFEKDSPYIFLAKLAWLLDDGGAYTTPSDDGRAAAELAFDFCKEVFDHRYAEVECFANHHAWTPWFFDVAWDWTVVLFDLRERLMWILVSTDTD